MADQQRDARIRAPKEHHRAVWHPDAAQAVNLAAEQHQSLTASEIRILGRPLAELRLWTRETLLAPIVSPPASPSDLRGELRSLPLIVTGHQPELFHPGVWLKNFATAGLAEAACGLGINLIVDSDLCTKTSITVPDTSREPFRLQELAFDAPQPPCPWEDYELHDAATMHSFAERVASLMESLGIEPLMQQVWPAMEQTLATSGKPADAFVAARTTLEQRWGVENVELKMSDVCRSEPFLFLIASILAEAARFTGIYNRVLADYRRRYRLRGRNHPVPMLESRGMRFETPFWVWKAGETARRGLWVEPRGDALALFAQDEELLSVPAPTEASWAETVNGIGRLADRGIRLRSRALTTTMFARLFLADLFVHGIGGARYDEMTDNILQQMWGIPAPRFVTLTGTVHLLPDDSSPEVSSESLAQMRHELRDLRQNPQRHLTDGERTGEALPLVRELQTLIEEQQAFRRGEFNADAAASRTHERRYRRLAEIRRQLAAWTREQQSRLSDQLAAAERSLQTQRVRQYREFSFVLHSEPLLRPFLLEAAQGAECRASACGG